MKSLDENENLNVLFDLLEALDEMVSDESQCAKEFKVGYLFFVCKFSPPILSLGAFTGSIVSV